MNAEQPGFASSAGNEAMGNAKRTGVRLTEVPDKAAAGLRRCEKAKEHNVDLPKAREFSQRDEV